MIILLRGDCESPFIAFDISMSIRTLLLDIAMGISIVNGSFLPLSKDVEKTTAEKSLFPSQSMYPKDGGSGIFISGIANFGTGTVAVDEPGPHGRFSVRRR